MYNYSYPTLDLPEGVGVLGKRLLVAPLRKDTTSSGLQLPDSADKPAEGIVAIGSGDYDERITATDLHPGERVLYSIYGCKPVEIAGETYVLVDAGDVYLTLPVEENMTERPPVDGGETA